MDQSESTENSNSNSKKTTAESKGETKQGKKFPLKTAMTYAALALAVASGGYAHFLKVDIDNTLAEHNRKLNSLNSKTSSLRSEMLSQEDDFDVENFKSVLTKELDTKINAASTNLLVQVKQRIDVMEKQSQNINLDEIIAQANSGASSDVEGLRFEVKALQESQNAIRADVEKAKSYAMRSDQRTVNQASTLNMLKAKVASLSINTAMQVNPNSGLQRLPDFSVLSVIPQGKHNVIVVQSPAKKNKAFNTITLVKDEPFTSRLGRHVVKEIIVDDKSKTAKIITKDGFYIDGIREKMTPTLLAKHKKKSPKKKSTAKKSSVKKVAKATPRKETRLAIKEWEVLTRYADSNTAVVINSQNGQTAEIKPTDVLKGYGRVVSIDKRTGRVDFDGYYIAGLDM